VVRRRQPEHDLPGGLRLRSWTVSDATGLLLALRDPLVRRYAGFLVSGRPEAELHVQRYAASWSAGDGPAWVVSDGSGSVLGSIRFGLVDRTLGCGMVGYWLLPQARGLGVVSAAVRYGSGQVFGPLGWHRVELRHAVENEPSCAVARRCGYRLEGTMRDAMRYPSDGRWSDEHLHARLAADREPPG
jgi:ribosomal-protein-alanine N-acetyltransferase